ncbi:hypothetical protein DSM106972_062360 [Dulcicalothrix desertica PCC 7102]|uniref:Uncharacterized protein n=1 Tax=Dulcicalothrix desertica PCC 7102 TaxID=232991 RepID=A0A433V7V1_9CYAN|nr:DUF5372 family protein [Dulcicalothrix desertica]RUT02161.1 hypothetical protein DSM106972_062360 [Dulcicalothrix desertica PCC 7102]
MTITNPIHPLYGQFVEILQIRKVGQETKVTIKSPLGGFLSLPASETDLWMQQASITQRTEKFSPQKLLRLSEWVGERKKYFTEEFSCVAENEGVEHIEKNHGEISTNPKTRKLRKAGSSNSSNSTVSGQDAQKPKFRRGSCKE